MIILKTPAEIEIMAEASRVVAEVLEIVRKEVRARSSGRERDSGEGGDTGVQGVQKLS
jgi:methionyl aminopeptidase